MGELSERESEWLDNVVSGVVKGIPIEADCETLDQQLCRDIFYAGTSLGLANPAIEGLYLGLYGQFELDEKGTPKYEHAYNPLVLKKLGRCLLGTVCCVVDRQNIHDEPQHMLIIGSVFTATPEEHFKYEFGLISDEDWSINPLETASELDMDERPALIVPGIISTGAHLAYKEVYTKLELEDQAHEDGDEFRPEMFQAIPGSEELIGEEAYLLNDIVVFPSVVTDIEARSKEGAIILSTHG